MIDYILDGAVHTLRAGERLPKEAVKITGASIRDDDGNPIAGVVVDPKTGIAVLDAALRADEEADPAAVELAHIVKQVEASMILSGIPLTRGLLAMEAEATGVELVALAEQVEAKAAPSVEREVARRVAKTGG